MLIHDGARYAVVAVAKSHTIEIWSAGKGRRLKTLTHEDAYAFRTKYQKLVRTGRDVGASVDSMIAEALKAK